MKLKSIKKQVVCLISIILLIISIAIAMFLYQNMKSTIHLLEDNCSLVPKSMTTTTILLQGNTSDDLQAAINHASHGDTITITSDIVYTSTTPKIITLYDADIMIQSDEGNNWKLIQTNPSTRHFDVSGGLTIQNITLEGNGIGGGIRLDHEHFTMNKGAVIQNCYSDFGGALSLQQGSRFIMNDGLITGNTASGSGGALYIYGAFYMYNGTISNNTSEHYGGGIFAHQSSIYIYGGNILNNIAKSNNGGGIYIDPPSDQSTPVISNAVISGNKSLAADGGGIYTDAPTMKISNITLTDNYAINGGGIYCSTFVTMIDSEISNNTAEENGGGIYIYYYYYMLETSFKIDRTIIANNKAVSGDGGGICLINENAVIIEIGENSSILRNSAPNGSGGGIYIKDIKNYANITTDSDTIFSCNTALTAYYPPENASTLYPNIGFASTTTTTHPINNFDINYMGTDVVVLHIIYDANGGVGGYIGPDKQPCSNDTVLSLETTEITNGDYIFIGWNTKSDGSGSSYSPGNSIKLKDTIVLYAQWRANEYTVIFESNGGTSIDTTRVPYSGLIIKPEDPTKSGYTFEGWYTDNDTFLNKWNFDTPVEENIILYAKWTKNSNHAIWIWLFIILLMIAIIFCMKCNCHIKCNK